MKQKPTLVALRQLRDSLDRQADEADQTKRESGSYIDGYHDGQARAYHEAARALAAFHGVGETR